MTNRAMSLLVHSDTKVGKTTLMWTMPAPRLVFDAEMAHRFMPGVKVFWDPNAEEPPQPGVGRLSPGGEVVQVNWDTIVVVVRKYQDMTKGLEWLNVGRVPVRSVGVDSISEIQTRLRDDLIADGRMTQQLWGDVLIQMEKVCRQFRDLTENPYLPVEAVVLTAMTQMKDGKWRPYLQGQAQVKTPYYFDVCGYLYIDQVQDPNDASQPPRKMRRMLVTPHPQFEAGERVQGRLGDVVDEPTVVKMLSMVFPPETAATVAAAPAS